MMKLNCPECNHEFYLDNKTELMTGDIPQQLFDILFGLAVESINGFYICSPFLSELSITGAQEHLKKIGFKKSLEVITRPITKHTQVWQKEQYDYLKKECKARMSVIDNLHAKMYILSADDASFAMSGSMNFTKGASSNVEIGIITRDAELYSSHYNAFHQFLKPMSEHDPL